MHLAKKKTRKPQELYTAFYNPQAQQQCEAMWTMAIYGKMMQDAAR
jgi:hypothetical protein